MKVAIMPSEASDGGGTITRGGAGIEALRTGLALMLAGAADWGFDPSAAEPSTKLFTAKIRISKKLNKQTAAVPANANLWRRLAFFHISIRAGGIHFSHAADLTKRFHAST